ncbi:MAG: 2,3-dihydro-2,3-dihydroxybenzoate dehydrogenase [Comamonas sp.]
MSAAAGTGTPTHSAAEFAGQHVLVTGAASGIGAALARLLLQGGARVTALDLDEAGLQAVASHARPGQWLALAVDVSRSADVDAAVAQAEAALGPIERLACVAGVLQMGRVIDLTDAQWQRALAVNAGGVFNTCRAVAARMVARQRGAIVNVSSNAATTPRAAMGAYAASKAAVTQLSHCLALELAEHGIRCNVVSPGSTDTEMQRAMWRQGSSRQAVIEGDAASYRLGIPLRKIATPEEVAEAILFLLSDRASHITLHDLRVDGGATLDR